MFLTLHSAGVGASAELLPVPSPFSNQRHGLTSFSCVQRLLPLSAMLLCALLAGEELQAGQLRVWPHRLQLSRDSPRQQLVVTSGVGSSEMDVTRAVTFEGLLRSVATVEVGGVVRAASAGTTSIVIRGEFGQLRVPVTVTDDSTSGIDFERDILPILTRFGCNAGACHGKQRGQNGFQLSLLGFDPQFDYTALVMEGRGRRVFPPAPRHSLLFAKPSGLMVHGGGLRFAPDSAEAAVLLDWISSGSPRSQPDAPELKRIAVFPPERVLPQGHAQQLAVTAFYDDGSTRDVTALATFQSNESPIAAVESSGIVTAGNVVGETAVMARYMNLFAIFKASVPQSRQISVEQYTAMPVRNLVDRHVRETLQRLRLLPSSPASDEKFLRRAFVDVIGRLPKADEVRRFLDNSHSDKRRQLVDWLLEQPEYADHWAVKWADLLRPNPYRVGIKATLNYDAWIRRAFRANQPYDEFVRELLTASGSTFRNGNVTLFRDRREPEELATIVSQLFLGTRLECARCHHHPFEVYGQDDFFRFAAWFAKIGRKGKGLSPPISGSEEFVFPGHRGSVRHPISGEVLTPAPIFGETRPMRENEDPRVVLAEWLTSPQNDLFAQTMANRVWTDLMGRGLVEPVDDLRATNPPANAALLRELGREFAEGGFDIKHLIRVITTSHTYGLSSLPNDSNIVDTRNYSRHYRRRLRGEVLLDALTEVTGVSQTFDAMPPDATAKQLWTRRISSLFLDSFGRPDPNQDPPCERIDDPTIVQTLHLMNSRDLYARVTADSGRAARLAASDRLPEQVVEELYLSVYSRRPNEDELKSCVDLYENEDSSRREVTEDLMWALINTPEFVFKD